MNDESLRNAAAAEWAAQERARMLELTQAPDTGDARVNSYRAVFHGIAQAPRAPVPADFADGIAQRLAEQARDEAVERWLLRMISLIALVAVLVYSGAIIVDIAEQTTTALLAAQPQMPLLRNPLVWATALSALLAGAFDQGLRFIRR